MCGIAGMVGARRLAPGDADRARRMTTVIEHRGPDEYGFHLDDQAALGHRRLSIIDLASGQQPLCNEDRSVWISFNGEIYNHRELRAQLEPAHRYHTRSDTETIVHAYEQWGDRCVERFRGMFAFAIWDSRRCRLLLARDRLGIKPLYWTLQNDRVIFASEIKAILETGLVQASANEDRIPELLATRYVAGSETLFRGIHKLLPGHLLSFEDGRVRIEQYWDVPLEAAGNGDRQGRAGSTRDTVRQFRDLLEESVRLRMMSDVPLGVFLSGGIDSSVIAALTARQMDRPLETFSVAFADRAFNELQYSRQVADAIGANRHEIVIDDRDFFGALPRLVWHEDEPIAHPSSVPLYYVSKLAREHVTVVLTGEGSDELLAGYGKYPRALWNWRLGGAYSRVVPPAIRSLVAGRVVPGLPARVGRYARRSFLAVPHTPEAAFFDNFAAIPLAAQRRLLSAPFAAAATPAAAYGASLEPYTTAARVPLLQRVLYTDIKTYLVELLMKQDQMSMAASVESRVPFLDHVLVEFAASLPPRWKLSGLTTKWILRAAARGLLPREILERPKMGFPVPLGRWLRSGWAATAREVLLDRRSRERGVVAPQAVAALIADHEAGRADGTDAIWSLINLELWYRTFIDGEGVQVLPSPGGRTAAAGTPDLAALPRSA
ncbi:MAG TPA: asparagine synthase (glutamine-hydrolyzing) [Vicinamibacterales bacterium]|nr:asparagine synthase (glutamine-hydrolyzing) [Vicinamibacterales bacterium]